MHMKNVDAFAVLGGSRHLTNFDDTSLNPSSTYGKQLAAVLPTSSPIRGAYVICSSQLGRELERLISASAAREYGSDGGHSEGQCLTQTRYQ